MIRQGDIYWITLPPPAGSEPGWRRPHVVLQNDLFNRSRLATTVVCALTSNLDRARSPGNVALARGEANLPKACVANITQVLTVDKSCLGEKIGTLSRARMMDILRGVALLLNPGGEPDGPGTDAP